MAYTFKGGIHINGRKHTAGCQVEVIPQPPVVKISMNQSTGTPSVPVVSKGDHVRVGQLIGDVPHGDLGCPVHASVSGTVTAIEEVRVSDENTETFVVIENDGKDEVSHTVVPYTESIRNLTPEDITERVRKAGIVGMGGFAVPAYEKISEARGKVEYLIVNCTESEPFVTADHRLILEHPEDVIKGVKILMRAVGAPKAYIAVENNKMNGVKRLCEALRDDKLISVKVMKTKYPQGNEHQLIASLTGRELPSESPFTNAGCVIFNVATCVAVYTALAKGMPSVRRNVTVSGDCVKTPKNLSVPIGTPASFLVEYCGGLVNTPEKLIFGGPMIGQAQSDSAMPVKKNTSAVILLSAEYSRKQHLPAACIRCGRCTRNCPMRLMPSYIAQFVQHGDMESAERYGAVSCIECGSCSYNCPGKVDVLQYIREAKNHIRTEAVCGTEETSPKKGE